MQAADGGSGPGEGSLRIRRKSRVGLIVGLIAGAVILVLLTCGGIAFWFFRGLHEEIPVAEETAKTFLRHLRNDRIAEAYAETTRGFQANTNEERFREFLKKFPALSNHHTATLTFLGIHRGTGGTSASFAARLHD